MLFTVAGERQIYKECNSFHADIEALDKQVPVSPLMVEGAHIFSLD